MAPRGNDPKKPDAAVVIRDFGGYSPNADPHDLTPGVAIRQINAMSWRPGELRVRPGYKAVQFDE
jgi:hypothetical protein